MLLSTDMDSSYFLIESSLATTTSLLNLHMDNNNNNNSSCPSSSSPLLATSFSSSSSSSASLSLTVNEQTSSPTTTANLNSDLEQQPQLQNHHSNSNNSSTSPLNYHDPFDGFSSFLLDQSYYGGGSNTETGGESCDRNSSSSNSYAMDPLDHTFSHQISSSSSPCLLMMHHNELTQHHHHHGNGNGNGHHHNSNLSHHHHLSHDHHHHHHHHHHQQQHNSNNIIGLINRNISGSIDSNDNNFSFQTDPDQEDTTNNDLPETLTSFVADLGGVVVDSGDAGYNSGVDLFCSSSHSHHNHMGGGGSSTCLIDCCGSPADSPEACYLRLALEQDNRNDCTDVDILDSHPGAASGAGATNQSSVDPAAAAAAAKRSVLMNLLINGSDVSAGYTIHNCRTQH